MRDEINAAYDAAYAVMSTVRNLAIRKQQLPAVPPVVVYAAEDERFSDEAEQWAHYAATVARRKETLLDELEQLATQLWDELTHLHKCSIAIGEAREYSYGPIGPCKYPPHNHWAFADVFSIGYRVHDWTFSYRARLSQPHSHVLNTPEFDELQKTREACPHNEEHENQIRGRLSLEKSQLLRDHTPKPAALVPANPKRSRRKPAVPVEKSKRELAFEWLKLWHRYGTEYFNTDPIPGKTERQQWMEGENEGKPGPCPSAFTRMFQEKFGSHAKYLNGCRNGSIKQLLTVAAGDAVRVYQSSKQSMERSTYDSEIDLD